MAIENENERYTTNKLCKIGSIVHDAQNNIWIYFGFRVTSDNTFEHHFIKSNDIPTGHEAIWMYKATYVDTLKRKFPDLEEVMK